MSQRAGQIEASRPYDHPGLHHAARLSRPV